jgi:hypothetical protein
MTQPGRRDRAGHAAPPDRLGVEAEQPGHLGWAVGDAVGHATDSGATASATSSASAF